MSKVAQFKALNEQLSTEVQSNSENSDPIAFLNSIIYTKHQFNADKLREEVISNNIKTETLAQIQAEYNNNIVNGLFESNYTLEKALENVKASQRRRLSVDFHEIEPITTPQPFQRDQDEDNLSQLRLRLLKSSGHSNMEIPQASMDDKIQLEESQQEAHLEDMLSLLGSLKEGAHAFNEKLQNDGNILKAAEAGLDLTKSKLQKSGEVLKKVSSGNVGVFDALKFGAACILLFLFALVLIKIFPKW